jgi:hypothetical protein
VIEPAQKAPALRILDLNGNLRSASASAAGLQISYQSNSRAIAVVSPRPSKIEIDGAVYSEKLLDAASNFVLMLPRGQHIVDLEAAPAHLSSNPH